MNEWLEYTLSILLFLDVGMLLVLILGLKPSVSKMPQSELPFLSVLVAARNEEKHLASCLQSFTELKYNGKIEFLIGNDASQDNTASIIQSFAERDQRIRYVPIEDGPATMNGKANAMAQLAKKSKGDFLLFTDADMVLNPEWGSHMVSSLMAGFKMLCGVTAIEGRSIFARCQSLDWLFAQGMLRVISTTSGTITAIGNNMGVMSNAYREAGGFESLEFTLTEDHELNKVFRSLGFKTGQEMHANALGFSKPESSISDWLQQRKRWMSGALKLPGWLIFLLTVHNLRWVLVLFFIFINSWSALVGLALLILDMIFLGRLIRILNLKFDFAGIMAFQVYQGLLYPLSILYFFMPFPLSWKGRKYT